MMPTDSGIWLAEMDAKMFPSKSLLKTNTITQPLTQVREIHRSTQTHSS